MGPPISVLKGLSPMDAYDVQARFAPIVFALLPLLLLAIVVVPGLGQMKLAGGTVAGLLVLVLPFVATRIARSVGRARQDALFAAWGGIPTTAMLRYRDDRLNPQTKRLFRDRLGRLGDAFPIPTEDQERADPTDADIKVGAAMNELRRLAKDRGLKAVHRENINYGAARNAYGLKPFGLALTLFSAFLLMAIVALRGGFQPTPLEFLVAAFMMVIGGAWIFVCTAANVGHHAEAYVLALFESIDVIIPQTSRIGVSASGRRPSRR
jgi:hypothetical protein